MVPDRSRRRARQAALVVRVPARQPFARELRTRRGQRVLVIPTDQTTRPESDPLRTIDTHDSATARLLLTHAHRVRHLLADRSVLETVGPSRRHELLVEIRRMRRVMRSLEEEIEVTTRSLDAMNDLVDHLRRLTSLLRGSGLLPPATRNVDDPSTDTATSADPLEERHR